MLAGLDVLQAPYPASVVPPGLVTSFVAVQMTLWSFSPFPQPQLMFAQLTHSPFPYPAQPQLHFFPWLRLDNKYKQARSR